MLEIEIKNLDEMQRKFAQSPEIVGRELSTATKESGKEILRQEVKEAPHDTGNLQRSIQMQFSPIRVKVWPNAKYAKDVHQGTDPHVIPISDLEGWARRHGTNAYAVQKAIAKRGTKANPFVRRTIEKITEPVNRLFQEALSRIVKML
jgi:HK97 gp10 family phage protein